jgi:hypothetical protein
VSVDAGEERSRSAQVKVHSNGFAIRLWWSPTRSNRSASASSESKSFGVNALRWTIGEVQLDLVEPGGVDQLWVLSLALDTLDRGVAGVGGAVVDPEDGPCGDLRLGLYRLGDEPAERVLAGRGQARHGPEPAATRRCSLLNAVYGVIQLAAAELKAPSYHPERRCIAGARL